MNVFINMLIICGIIIGIVVVIYVFLNQEVRRMQREERITYDQLIKEVSDMVNDYISMNVSGMGLTKQAIRKQENQRRGIARSVRTCCSGNSGSRVVVKDLIYSYLVNRGMDDATINYAVPFNQPKIMTARQLFETMVYMNDRTEESGLLKLHERYNFIKPREDARGNIRYEVAEQDIREMYEEEGYVLSTRDKLAVLTQLLYSDSFGLGVIDTINQQKGCVEEIQMGLSGLQQFVYDYREEIREDSEKNLIRYSKDAIHIIISGINIWLSFLGFNSEGEMQRVLRNLIKDSSAGELTIDNPEAVVEAVDGRRITVSRPPITDSWVGFIRKFDTLVSTDFDTMYNEKQGANDVNDVIRNLVRSGSNIGFTGEMSAGKTSAVRAGLMETRPDLSIRVVESGSFEINVRRFLPSRNSLAMRVTEFITEEEVLKLIRKTTGQIFCIGEVNSLAMANLAMNLAKFSKQMIFSAHYVDTDSMVQDFVAAKLCEGKFTSEKLAEMDAVSSLQFDIHIRMKFGRRYIEYINEVVPDFDFEKHYDREDVTEDNAMIKAVGGIREVRKQLGKARTYEVRPILAYNEQTQCYDFYNRPSQRCYDKARLYMTSQQYEEFCSLFERVCPKEDDV